MTHFQRIALAAVLKVESRSAKRETSWGVGYGNNSSEKMGRIDFSL